MKIDTEKKYYKCLSDDYESFDKGRMYSGVWCEGFVRQHPEDWKEVLPYPNTLDLIDCIENGKNKTKVLKALKQWKNHKH